MSDRMDAEGVETLILRFRDLVTEPHGTLESHRAILAEKKEVWWGWWSKQGESVPQKLFSALLQRLTQDNLTIYLFDSGHSEIYEATLNKIQWDNMLEPIPSPDAALTPDYYKGQKYPAWFKFTDIANIASDAGTLKSLTYVRVDDFFASSPSKYAPFYGKRIGSPEELRQQDRSIWFVREFQDGDPVHEIFLLEPERLKPSHFVERYRQTEGTDILWVSDLHFSRENHHAFPIERNHTQRPIQVAIDEALKKHALGPIAAAVCSGDFTWKATRDEFDLAGKFIREIASWCRLEDYDFGFCPGNHDIRFSSNPAQKGTKVDIAPEEAKAEYAKFYRDHFYQSPNNYLACGRRYLLGNAFPVEIAYLNSSYLDQKPELFQGHGFVGHDQLMYVAREMGWEADSPSNLKPYRIVVVHHHMIPVTYREEALTGINYSVMLDAEALMRWLLRHRVDLVLHGHMHQPFVSKIMRSVKADENDDVRTISIAGMGSTGVSATHLGEIKKNTFGVISFREGRPMLAVYSIDPSIESELEIGPTPV